MFQKSEYFSIIFSRRDGMIHKSFSGFPLSSDYFSIEAGITMAIQSIYNGVSQMANARNGGKPDDDALFVVTFKRDKLGNFAIDLSGTMDKNDAENIILGLTAMLMQMHLKRMKEQETKITIKDDGKLSPVSFESDESLT